jgi:lipopolysaccharide/colanic/teichoic acid biosynthesis glycosyltransferase
MIVLKIILWIIAIAAVVGVVATVADLLGKRGGHKPYGPYERFVKRGLDAFLATGALIVLSPVLLVTAILVRVKLGSPVLFTQERPGRDGKIFKLYKFRTMTDARDEKGELLPDDQRLPVFGQKLRSTSLDELPELLNIIKGDMSIIGPRPLLVQYLPYYTETEKHRHDVRPGLSGLAQVNGRNFVKWDQRLAIDVEYVNKITFIGDASIVLRTIKKVFAKEDTVAETVTVENHIWMR